MYIEKDTFLDNHGMQDLLDLILYSEDYFDYVQIGKEQVHELQQKQREVN